MMKKSFGGRIPFPLGLDRVKFACYFIGRISPTGVFWFAILFLLLYLQLGMQTYRFFLNYYNCSLKLKVCFIFACYFVRDVFQLAFSGLVY